MMSAVHVVPGAGGGVDLLVVVRPAEQCAVSTNKNKQKTITNILNSMDT
jgi:hypothetical protein